MTWQTSSFSILPKTTVLPSGDLQYGDFRIEQAEVTPQAEEAEELNFQEVKDDYVDVDDIADSSRPSSWQQAARIRYI